MKIDKYIASLVIVLITGILGSGLAWSEVKFEQLNEKNLVVKVKGEDWQPSTNNWENGQTIPVTWINKADISLDGKATEKNWDRTPEIAVPLYWGNVNNVFVQALYTVDDVYVKLRWQDDTEDRQHHPWVWDKGAREFVAGPQIEDSVILSFEAHCEWTPSFLSGYGFDFDGWQWLAARSDPLGQAVDIEGNVKASDRPRKQFASYTSRNNEIIWNVKFLHDKGEGIFHANWNELERVYMLQPVGEDVLYRQSSSEGAGIPLDTRGTQWSESGLHHCALL